MFAIIEPATWALIYTASEWVLRVVMVVTVPMRRSPEAAKGWLLLIFFLPWPGLALYLLIGRPRLPRWREEQLKRFPGAMRPVVEELRQHPCMFSPDLGPELEGAVRLARRLGHLPILGGSAAEILTRYEGVLERLVADIDAARSHVHLLFYIYADDATTRPVTEALCRAARRGVTCRVLIDALGSRAWLGTLLPTLREAGVLAHEMLPVTLFGRKKLARLDLRNHRKIAIIDGQVAYAGSQNLVAATFKEGITYEELMVRVTGPVVLSLQYVFISDWFLETEEILRGHDTFPEPKITGTMAMQVLPSGPQFPSQPTQRVLVALVHGARKRVVITTPYFIPDEALFQALETAATRGVEVHLVVSSKKDQLLVGLAQESYYEELLEKGVQIHLYKDNFLHAKHVSIDDDVALVGSSNIDIRSFVLNAEVSVLIYDMAFTAALRQIQDQYFAHCERLTMAKWQSRSLPRQLVQNLARLLSPLL